MRCGLGNMPRRGEVIVQLYRIPSGVQGESQAKRGRMARAAGQQRSKHQGFGLRASTRPCQRLYASTETAIVKSHCDPDPECIVDAVIRRMRDMSGRVQGLP